MKLCKNCKHRKSARWHYFCYHPDVVGQNKLSVVDGSALYKHCNIIRGNKSENNSYAGLCGESGKLYEPNLFRKILIKLKVVDE